MLNEQTFEKLYALKLFGMADAFKEQMNRTDMNDLSFEERVGLLVDAQYLYHENRRMKRLLVNARLKLAACIEDIDWRSSRGLDRVLITELAGCDWLRRTHNVLITGATGVGKTWLACALGQRAARSGFKCSMPERRGCSRSYASRTATVASVGAWHSSHERTC